MKSGIHANVDLDRATFTWESMRWFGNFSLLNTFQVTLFKRGSIHVAYGAMAGTDAVVGIALGGGAGPAIAVDLSELAGAVEGATIYEDFFVVKGP